MLYYNNYYKDDLIVDYMSYGEFSYQELKNAPEYLKALGLKAVYVPRQDGTLEHYAFLSLKDGSEMFVCGNLDDLVDEGKEKFEKMKKGK